MAEVLNWCPSFEGAPVQSPSTSVNMSKCTLARGKEAKDGAKWRKRAMESGSVLGLFEKKHCRPGLKRLSAKHTQPWMRSNYAKTVKPSR